MTPEPNLPRSTVTIFATDEVTNYAEQIFVASGTTTLHGHAATADFYAIGSVIPKAPFLEASPEMVQRVLATESAFDPLHHVALTAIPADVRQPMADLIERYGDNHAQLMGASSFQEALDAVQAHVLRRFSDGSPHQTHRLSSHPPGCTTVTINKAKGAYNGLHVDSWEGLSSEERTGGRVRVCINLGPQRRYFLFLDQSLVALRNHAGAEPIDDPELGRHFLVTQPEYPVYAMAVDPGQAYIAATECLTHDASTIDATKRIYALQIRLHVGSLKRWTNQRATGVNP